MSWIGGAISAAGGIAGGLIGAYSNERAARIQGEMQQDMINRQNVYNSPANQMKRLQEAGLNPNLVYSGGNVTGNQSGTGTAPTIASNGDYGISRALQGIQTHMAIENHDMDMQMKQQQLLQEKQKTKSLPLQIAAQLQKTASEDRLINTQILTGQHNNDILKHDRNIITYNPDMISNFARSTNHVDVALKIANDLYKGARNGVSNLIYELLR